MSVHTEADLFRRETETLVASWEEYSRSAAGAFVQRFPGVAVAVFPNEPERALYNNALLTRDLMAAERTAGIDAMEAAYAGAGVARFAAWVHESDEAMRADLEQRGYTVDTSTRAMAMPLDDIRLPGLTSNSRHRTGPNTYASPACRRTSFAAPTRTPTTS